MPAPFSADLGERGNGAGLWVLFIAALSMLGFLGVATPLTYHEAFTAQAAREMLASGDVLVPSINGMPWLEKPPGTCWLVALLGFVAGGVDETVARLPSAAAGVALALGVAFWTSRRFGSHLGLLAGCVQATTLWTVSHARLAEADMILAALFAWTLIAFDLARFDQPRVGTTGPLADRTKSDGVGSRFWRGAFFALLGLMSLFKGVGFGAALVSAVVVATLLWNRDRAAWKSLLSPWGCVVVLLLTLAWPLLATLREPRVLELWGLHLFDRFAARPRHFAGGPWWQYGPPLLGQVLPWTPFALWGAALSIRRARDGSRGDRLLCAWVVAPVVVLSFATIKNIHYAVHALAPCSVWSALALARLSDRLQRRGLTIVRFRHYAVASCLGLAGLYCLGFGVLGPYFDRRGAEWSFYREASRAIATDEPAALLYDDWDRLPYYTPFGPVPHDLGLRLFYIKHRLQVRFGVASLAAASLGDVSKPYPLVAREHDLPELRRLGRVERVATGASARFDRAFVLFRFAPDPARVAGLLADQAEVRR